ncbi:MAG: DUF4876 domain-containing protein [Muribaculaceae bacterium]|nr:DUF4876 domain-containing protein [Muribaculaceae bacterium]
MKANKFLVGTLIAGALLSPALVSCSSDDTVPTFKVGVEEVLPQGYTIQSVSATFTEVNTGAVTTTTNLNELNLPAGTYNIEATAKVTEQNAVEKTMRAVAQNVVITEKNSSIKLDWFFFNPDNSLVISEIYLGSLNAKGTGLIYDSYIKIYNNTDETIYADGLAICESNLNNSTDYLNLSITPAEKFIAGTVYVIPGNGTDYPIEPGKSIKIADQAINWTEQVAKAQNHTDADFEWYDVVTIGTVRDTDNPAVPNLDKWYSYSATIWILSQQANRSYALVRFPAGVNMEKYLSDYTCSYTYTNAATSKEVTNNNKYYIPLDWIIDGVNLCPTNKSKFNCLPANIDMSYKAIADDYDKAYENAYKTFVRRQSGTSAAGNIILQDTDDSAKDFDIVAAF